MIIMKALILLGALALAGRVSLAQQQQGLAQRYLAVLTALGEPDLGRSQDTAAIYRALWLRSFHQPFSVRIIRSGSSYSVVTATALPTSDGRSYQPPTRDSTVLSQEAWAQLQMRTAMREIWRTEAPENRGGMDGAQWILEARVGSRYHAVDWWTPQGNEGREGGYRRLFLEILSLGKVCVSPEAVY